MAHITLEQIKAAYLSAGRVYDGELRSDDAASELQDRFGLNINSARDFLHQFRKMMRGETFTRSLNASALEYFLSAIAKERGPEAANNAVAATWRHIEYYENVEGSRMKKLRSVVEKFQMAQPGLVSMKDHEAAFAAAVKQSARDSSAARMKRLKNANTTPAFLFVTTKVYARNPDVIVEVLLRAAGSCELCKKPAPFRRKSDGSPFLEVHHKTRLANGGEDTIDNAIALCPNCHRREHYG
jgi:5-methylcytosine-specific restriction protein A